MVGNIVVNSNETKITARVTDKCSFHRPTVERKAGCVKSIEYGKRHYICTEDTFPVYRHLTKE